VIISGKDKGEKGFVYAVSPKEQKAIVLKVNDENPDQPLPLNTAISIVRLNLRERRAPESESQCRST